MKLFQKYTFTVIATQRIEDLASFEKVKGKHGQSIIIYDSGPISASSEI